MKMDLLRAQISLVSDQFQKFKMRTMQQSLHRAALGVSCTNKNQGLL